MSTLAEIFNKWGTDKGQLFNNSVWHGYAGFYECLFHRYRKEVKSVLEIGIGTMIDGVHSSMVGWALQGYRPGGSLRAWREYFENATIYGIDVQPDTRIENEERIVTFLCDSTDTARVQALIGGELPVQFDLIIDDGSHLVEDQIQTMRNFFPYVAQNGIYVLEDIVGRQFERRLDSVKQICNDNPCLLLGDDSKIFAVIKIR